MATSLAHNKMLSTLVIFILTVSNIWLVHSDEALVKDVCQRTPNPDVCEQCLKFADADKTGLAVRSIRCSLRNSGVVNSDLVNIALGSGDPAVKDKCARCEQLIGVDIIQNLLKAISLLKDGDSAGAANELSAAVEKLTECGGLNIPASPRFSEDYVWLMRLFVNTQAILHEL